MSKIYRSVLEVSWALGVISVVVCMILKVFSSLQGKLGVSPRGGMMLAVVLFLCVLATGGASKTSPSS
jgi:hypothetical protein